MNPFKNYLQEGIADVLSDVLDRLASHQKNHKKMIQWAKYESHRSIALYGFAHTLKEANAHCLIPIQSELNSLHDVARRYNDQLFSAAWNDVAEKLNELTVDLRKIESAVGKVRNDRDLSHLLTEWGVWGVDYQDLVEAYAEAVGDFEEQIQELF